jgi:hypothetical protein
MMWGLISGSIEHSFAEPSVGEGLWLLGEGQVGGHDDGCFFGSLCDHLKERFGSNFGQRDIAEFIDYDRFHAGPTGQHPAEALISLCFDKLVD